MLNAFRHHWNLHPRQPSRDRGAAAVLNAFRHHWNLHEQWVTRRCRDTGAQRLSASLESSQDSRSHFDLSRRGAQRLSASLESSPYVYLEPFLKFQVLNAFRHHWNLHGKPHSTSKIGRKCSTPFGIIGIFTTPIHSAPRCSTCAQRLSASLESSHAVSIFRVANLPGAQRLSASLESSPRRHSSDCPRGLVLNAFRHHWNLHAMPDCASALDD